MEGTFFKVNYPEFIDSKSAEGIQGEQLSLDALCLIDWMPRPIAEFIFSEELLRSIAETDFKERQVWGPDSWMRNQGFFQERSERDLQIGDIIGAVENYIYYIHNRVSFTGGVRSFQHVAILNADELQKIASPNRREITPYEADLIKAIRSFSFETDENGLNTWIATLRTDKEVHRLWEEIRGRLYKYIPKGELTPYKEDSYLEKKEVQKELPLARKIRTYARERRWFKTAAEISQMLKEPEEELNDRIACYSRYYHAKKAAKLEMIKDILVLAKFTRREDIVDEWIAVYGRDRERIEGEYDEHYGGMFRGWYEPGIAYDEETGCWISDSKTAEPLLIKLANTCKGFEFRLLSEEDKLDLARKLGGVSQIDIEDLRRYIENHWKYSKDPEERKPFYAILKAGGIELEGPK